MRRKLVQMFAVVGALLCCEGTVFAQTNAPTPVQDAGATIPDAATAVPALDATSPVLQAFQMDRMLSVFVDNESASRRAGGIMFLAGGAGLMGVGLVGALQTDQTLQWFGWGLLPAGAALAIGGGITLAVRGGFQANLQSQFRERLRTEGPEAAMRWIDVHLEGLGNNARRWGLAFGITGMILGVGAFATAGVFLSPVVSTRPDSRLLTATGMIISGTFGVSLAVSAFVGQNVFEQQLRLLRAGRVTTASGVAAMQPWITLDRNLALAGVTGAFF